MIGSGATSKGDFGSTGQFQEVGSNHIDHETCNDLYDGDIVDSVMHCVGAPCSGEYSCQHGSGSPIFDPRESTRSEELDRYVALRAVEYSPCLWG